ARSTVETEEQAAIRRLRAMRATADRRAELAGATRELSTALDDGRPARVLAAARGEGAEHLVAALGPAPEERASQAVWCGLALEVEAWRDRHRGDQLQPDPREPEVSWLLGPRPVGAWESWGRVANLVSDAPELLQVARSRGIGEGAGLD